MKAKAHIYYLLIISILCGCYSQRQVGLLQERKGLAQYDSVPYVPYKLQVNDEIIYRIFSLDHTITDMLNNTNTSKNAWTYRIYSDGTIDVPFVASVPIAGLTEQEAQDTLQARLRTVIPDAEVKLALNNKYFTVLGDVRSGKYPIYKEKLTIYQALALTGDLFDSADREKIRIIRPQGNEKPQIIEFDIRSKSIINSPYYYVYPNDIIYVGRMKDNFYKVPSYTTFLALVTSSVSLLVTVLNFTGL